LCGLSGLLRFTRTEWDPSGDQLPRHITFELSDVVEGLDFENVAGYEPGLAGLFAERVHIALTPIWKRFAMDLNEPFGYGVRKELMAARSLRLAQLFYVNREASGRAFLATIDLTHSLCRSNSGHYNSVLKAPAVRLFVRGARQCVRSEPPCGSVGRDAEALQILEAVFQRARHATRCAAAIGGPVDIAVIDTGGRRWLRQKPECRLPKTGPSVLKVPERNGPIPPSE